MARVNTQLDKVVEQLSSLTSFVQTSITKLDSAEESHQTAVARWWDKTWPQHEEHHVVMQARITSVELAISTGRENASAISALGVRLAALETLRTRAEGAAWLGRYGWGLIVFAGIEGLRLLIGHYG